MTTTPTRPSWLSDSPAIRDIFTLRRVYRDGVNTHRRAGGTREWQRWAGWRAVSAELANTIAFNAACRGVDSHPDDLALFRRVQDLLERVAPPRTAAIA